MPTQSVGTPAQSAQPASAPARSVATPAPDTETSIPSLRDIPLRYRRLRERVLAAEAAVGREAGSVSIELAAKYQAPERILAALSAGATLFGHNIIQQLETSEEALAAANAPEHRTHVIGHLQKNKAGKALCYAQCIETLDSLDLAQRLDRLQARRREEGTASEPFDVMLQVNSSGAPSQFGVPPAALPELAGKVAELRNLRIIGLMTIGAHTEETAEIARSFRVVRELAEELRASGISTLTELSMGMTQDLEIAVAEGSTIVRVGTAVFGPRPTA
ncbi:MAG: YggS family pyridoxal phosphate-dependent enzyme [Actinomycetaceae bacterium]|nr:YggS family pyridoxal phosphate-dependent enzyme [Actinomycetaceae bacterium]